MKLTIGLAPFLLAIYYSLSQACITNPPDFLQPVQDELATFDATGANLQWPPSSTGVQRTAFVCDPNQAGLAFRKLFPFASPDTTEIIAEFMPTGTGGSVIPWWKITTPSGIEGRMAPSCLIRCCLASDLNTCECPGGTPSVLG